MELTGGNDRKSLMTLNDTDLNDRKSLMTLNDTDLHKTQIKDKNTGKTAENRGFDANSVKNTL